MIQKVKLTTIASTNKKKDGTVMVNKFGNFWRVGIKTEQHEDQWLNGFTKYEPKWEVGDEIDIEVTTEEFNGKEQLKFRVAKKDEAVEEVEENNDLPF